MRKLVLVLLLGVLAAGTASFAQGRPQCSEIDRPGVCFWDDGGAVVYWVNVTANGDAYVVGWYGDDFCQVRNDGTQMCMQSTQEADSLVCPVTAGGWDCALEYFSTGVLPEGALVGYESCHTSGIGVYGLDWTPLCPIANQFRAEVFDGDGVPYIFTAEYMSLKAPGTDECRVKKDTFSIKAVKP